MSIAAPAEVDVRVRQEIRDLLQMLPPDVVQELNQGGIEIGDTAFFDGLTDHVSRLAIADPQKGRRMLGKLIKLKKRIAREVRQSNPDVPVSSTITRRSKLVGRNGCCPCGSGKKFKHCCLRKR